MHTRHSKNSRHPRVMLIFSMAVFGTLGVFTRNIQVSSGELALYRAILAAGLILVYLLVTRQPVPFSSIKKEIPLLLASGVAMGINWILLFEAYRYTTISVATLSYYFAPVIVTAVCPFLFHERLTKKQLFCFIMSTLGLFMIIGAGYGAGEGKDLPGQETAILSYIDPLTAALVSVTLLGERMTPLQVMGGAFILGFTLWNEKE